MIKSRNDLSVNRLKRYIRQQNLLLSQRRFDELEKLLDKIYGQDSDERHAEACRLMWEKGKRAEALDEILEKLKSKSYSIKHVILAADYTFQLKRSDAADFLMNSFTSKYEEESSIMLIEFVYNYLNNIPSSEEVKEVGRIML